MPFEKDELNEKFYKDSKLKRLFIRKNTSESRQKDYVTVLKELCELTGKMPTELIDEAKNEQKAFLNNNGLPEFKEMEDRKINIYYYDYYESLVKKELKNSTIKTKLSGFRAFYKEYDVELPKPIEINENTEPLLDKDIPSIEDIRKAVEHSSNKRNKAIILLMASSGIRSSDVRNFKVKDFINATSHYHAGNTIEDILNYEYDDVIACWEFKPQKTIKQGNFCMTFNTPEASSAIIDYLKERNHLHEDDYLFISQYKKQIGYHGFIDIFKTLNDRLFGRKENGERFFKAHSLRKFFKTTALKNSHEYKKIDIMAGHKQSRIELAYETINKDDMMWTYTNLIPHLSIKDTEVRKMESKDYKELKELKKQVTKQDEENRKIRELLEKTGDIDKLI